MTEVMAAPIARPVVRRGGEVRTKAPEPGHDALRPPQATPIPSLALAGDYTRQPYLATMEGAVVSGRMAADVVEETAHGRPVRLAPVVASALRVA